VFLSRVWGLAWFHGAVNNHYSCFGMDFIDSLPVCRPKTPWGLMPCRGFLLRHILTFSFPPTMLICRRYNPSFQDIFEFRTGKDIIAAWDESGGGDGHLSAGKINLTLRRRRTDEDWGNRFRRCRRGFWRPLGGPL